MPRRVIAELTEEQKEIQRQILKCFEELDAQHPEALIMLVEAHTSNQYLVQVFNKGRIESKVQRKLPFHELFNSLKVNGERTIHWRIEAGGLITVYTESGRFLLTGAANGVG